MKPTPARPQINLYQKVTHDTGFGTFQPGHMVLAESADREAILGYLDAGVTLAITDARIEDVVDPLQGYVVPLDVRTDGMWIWTDTVSHYLRTYGYAPDPELVTHIRERGTAPDFIDGVALFRALHRLQRTDDDALVQG